MEPRDPGKFERVDTVHSLEIDKLTVAMPLQRVSQALARVTDFPIIARLHMPACRLHALEGVLFLSI